jgi:hypothetical protein
MSNTPTTQPNLVTIQDDTFYYSVFLVNSDKRVFILRPEAIKELVISDNITEYYSSGYIILDNKFDAIEQPSTVAQPNSDLNINGFLFRGDARDVLRIEIMPKLNQKPIGADSDETTKKLFSLSYEFIVYNIEEILGDEPGMKYKKLYFWDINREILLEKNVQFSTADYINTGNVANLDHFSRGISTGNAIKNLITKTFPKTEGFTTEFDNFDPGSINIFFTSPSDYKAQDCLDYVLDLHVSNKNNNYDPCFLKISRYPKKWSLTSLSDYFKKAYNQSTDTGGDLFLEKFLLGGFNISNPGLQNYTVSINRSPNLALYLPKYATLDNFSFLPSAGVDNQLNVNSRNVHSYNYSNKQFSIDIYDNDFETAKDIYFQNYVKPMKGSNKSIPVNNIIDNLFRVNRSNISNIFSTSYFSKQQRLSQGRNKFLTSSIFLNNSITFRVKGATYRQSGRFISIDRNDAIPDNDFNNKFLGIYMIVDVKHVFSQNIYYNDLICVKTYLYKDIGNVTNAI